MERVSLVPLQLSVPVFPGSPSSVLPAEVRSRGDLAASAFVELLRLCRAPAWNGGSGCCGTGALLVRLRPGQASSLTRRGRPRYYGERFSLTLWAGKLSGRVSLEA